MKIAITLKYLKEFAKINDRTKVIAERDLYWGKDENRTEFEISNFPLEELQDLHKFLNNHYNTTTSDTDKGIFNACLQKVVALMKVKSDPLVAVKGLDALQSALTEYVRKSPEKWVFSTGGDNRNLPYLVTEVKYEPATKDRQAYTQLSLRYVQHDEVRTSGLTWHMSDLMADSKNSKKFGGFNVQELLDRKGYILGVQELIDVYEKETEVYFKYRDMIGEQFTSNSVGFSETRYSYNGPTAMNTDGTPHKLVVDEKSERKIEAEDKTGSVKFWNEDEENFWMRTPIHMYIKVFNLKNHIRYSVHTSTLTPYVYDTKLIHKLVLPREVKELIEILGRGTAEGLGDIISGKAEGIIVGCVGAPGLGKTLSAEVYSEFLQRPLYSVQCAQLGVDSDTLEKRLTDVLNNAQRWKAILLLDEADVYIRKRGHDIKQNAIVGVFLRVLEYYRGIIFLTTNLANSIDDAIESRFSAKIVFDYPEIEAAKEIWRIQIANHGWEVDEEMVDLLVTENPAMSGRSIRSLIKLATLLAKFRKTDLNMTVLKHASKFAVLKGKPEPEPDVTITDEKGNKIKV